MSGTIIKFVVIISWLLSLFADLAYLALSVPWKGGVCAAVERGAGLLPEEVGLRCLRSLA